MDLDLDLDLDLVLKGRTGSIALNISQGLPRIMRRRGSTRRHSHPLPCRQTRPPSALLCSGPARPFVAPLPARSVELGCSNASRCADWQKPRSSHPQPDSHSGRRAGVAANPASSFTGPTATDTGRFGAANSGAATGGYTGRVGGGRVAANGATIALKAVRPVPCGTCPHTVGRKSRTERVWRLDERARKSH